MARSTNVGKYKAVWKRLGNETYRVDSEAKIEKVLANGKIIDKLAPRYAALHDGSTYILLSVSNNNAIVASFELDSIPDDISYQGYDVDDHCRDRMVQRNITTGVLREMLQDYVVLDRLSRHKFKLICRTDDDWYRSIVNTETEVIETVWQN